MPARPLPTRCVHHQADDRPPPHLPGALGNTKQSPLGVGPQCPAAFAAICLTFLGPLSPSVLVSLALSTPDNLHGQAGAALPLRLRVTLSVLWSCIPLLGRNSEDLLIPRARKPFPPLLLLTSLLSSWPQICTESTCPCVC